MIRSIKHLIDNNQRRITIAIVVLSLLVMIWFMATLLSPHLGSGSISRGPVYIGYGVLLGFSLLISRKVRVDWPLAIFLVIAAVSIAVNDVDSFYQPWPRWALLAVVMGLFSPLLMSDELFNVRRALYKWLLVGMRVAVLASVVFSPYWYAKLGTTTELGKGGVMETHLLPYTGVLNHGMMMSFVAAVVAADALWRLLNQSHGRAVRLFYGILLLSAIGLMVAGASRCSMMAFVLAAIAILATSTLRWTRRGVMIAVGCAMIIGAALALAPSRVYAPLRTKIEFAKKKNSVTISRDELWEARLLEFKDSPVIGIGLANFTHFSDRFDIINPSLGRYMGSEPASSWLSVLSNTGVLGAAMILWFNVQVISRMVRARRQRLSPMVTYYAALYLILIVNGVFEGWILYGGAFHGLIYWLITSRIFEITYSHEDIGNHSHV